MPLPSMLFTKQPAFFLFLLLLFIYLFILTLAWTLGFHQGLVVK